MMFYIFFISIFLSLGVNSKSTTTESVQCFVRHGDRTPDVAEMKFFPNYAEINNTWYPIGSGYLTNGGILHMYELGEALRTNYKNLLEGASKYPVYDTVRTYTTNVTRTQSSALALLAGLLPPPPALQWGPEKLAYIWRPITYSHDDIFIQMLDVWYNCPAFTAETERVHKLPEVRAKSAKFDGLKKIISKNVGKTVTSPLEMIAVKTIYESQEAAGIPKPKWVTDNWQAITEQADFLYQTLFYSDVQKKLGAGIMLKQILDDAEAKANGKKSLRERRMTIYSGHDITVMPIFAALGGAGGFLDEYSDEYPIHAPEYTATFAIELHKSVSTGEYGIKFFYADGDHILRSLRRSDCPEFCPLDELIHLTKGITLDSKSFKQECNAGPNHDQIPEITTPASNSSTTIKSGLPPPGFSPEDEAGPLVIRP